MWPLANLKLHMWCAFYFYWTVPTCIIAWENEFHHNICNIGNDIGQWNHLILRRTSQSSPFRTLRLGQVKCLVQLRTAICWQNKTQTPVSCLPLQFLSPWPSPLYVSTLPINKTNSLHNPLREKQCWLFLNWKRTFHKILLDFYK